MVELEQALPYTMALPFLVAGDFSAAIVRAWKKEDGDDIYIDGSPEKWEMVHGDYPIWQARLVYEVVFTSDFRYPAMEL